MKHIAILLLFACLPLFFDPSNRGFAAEDGWQPLFNGKDFSGWQVPQEDNGHWKVVDGVIDYDAMSEAKGDRNLWTEREFGDFVLKLDWRIKQTKGPQYPAPTILPDGSYKTDEDGQRITTPIDNADSGIYLRGESKAQLNIWCWPAGSGEVWGYRNDVNMPPEVRAGCVPKVRADNPVGEWNTFVITMKGDRLNVELNGQTVIDNVQLPGIPEKGKLALQHHGGVNKKTGEWLPASSLMQFRNISIKELPGGGASATEHLPNFVIVYIDDMGYADIGPFGAKGYETPHLDRLASEGRKFTDFYVTQAVCSASRAGLVTGCYNVRVGILGALSHSANHGLNADEMTIAEVVKQKGYATACYGKWHLGHHPKFLPTNHGFDEYFGLPYSNDMWPYHPTAGDHFCDLPLFENTRVVDSEVTGEDQENLTTWYTEHAVNFIAKNKDKPFLVYLPHSMVHVPLYVSDKFRGKSERGLFGDVVMEVDWSVGQILAALEKHGLDENTMVVFATDNGPWLSYGDHAGSAGPLREGKGTMFDGGCRVPTVMRWPGKIPPGTVCKTPAMTIDLLPTIAHLVGAKLPNHKIDGKNIWPLIAGEPGAISPQEAYYFYYGSQLQAVRMGRWKLHFPHGYRTLKGRPGGTGGTPVPYEQAKIGLALFDMEKDPGETTDVAAEHPDIVEKIKALAERMRADLGDAGPKQKGSGAREPGRIQEGDLWFDWKPGVPLNIEPVKK